MHFFLYFFFYFFLLFFLYFFLYLFLIFFFFFCLKSYRLSWQFILIQIRLGTEITLVLVTRASPATVSTLKKQLFYFFLYFFIDSSKGASSSFQFNATERAASISAFAPGLNTVLAKNVSEFRTIFTCTS